MRGRSGLSSVQPSEREGEEERKRGEVKRRGTEEERREERRGWEGEGAG